MGYGACLFGYAELKEGFEGLKQSMGGLASDLEVFMPQFRRSVEEGGCVGEGDCLYAVLDCVESGGDI